MKMLIVARYKERGFAPFVTEQVEALEKVGIECRYFPMRSKGIWGYLRQLPELKQTIREYNPDVVHAHYGLCGLFANLQRKIPVVTTYHGSDINETSVRQLSKLVIRLSAYNIFVSQKCIDLARPKEKYALIPCGINLEDFKEVEKTEAREMMGLKPDGKYALFAGAFDNAIKNVSLAMAAASMLPDVELLELKGYNRYQVALLMQAVDTLLMTSLSEGSPQVIKEALASGCPIVSVDVGDVKERVSGVDGCYVVDGKVEDVATALKKALAFGKKNHGRDTIMRDGLTNDAIASRLKEIYTQLTTIR